MGRRFVELGHFDQDFIKKKTEKETPQEKILQFFLLDILKSYILDGKFNPEMDTIRAFLSKNHVTFSSPPP